MTTQKNIWDLLDYVESKTNRKFIVADAVNSAHHMQFWYARYIAEYRCTKYFSNRPFPQIGKAARKKELLPATEQFLRVDAELPNHSQVPTKACRDEFIAWAKAEGAIGSLQTPHGSHAYFLFDTPFPWTNAKAIVNSIAKTYLGEYTFCDASWCTSDWSRTNTNKNVSLDFFNTTTKAAHTLLYCDTIAPAPESGVSTSKSTVKRRISTKARTGGSRQANNEEFKRVWWEVKNGKSVDQATQNLEFHTKSEIVKALNDPRYAINSNSKGVGVRIIGGKLLDAKIGYAGAFSNTRLIQRSTSIFAQIAHSVADLRELSNERALSIIEGTAKFAGTKDLITANFGPEWKPKICQLLDNSRQLFGVGMGKVLVSNVVLDIALLYVQSVERVVCKALHEHLKLTLPIPVSVHAQPGSSLPHTKRILRLLVKAGILLPFYAGPATSYKPVAITKVLLDKLSSCNLKQPLHTPYRDLQEKQADKDSKRPVRVTRGLQVSGRGEAEVVESDRAECQGGNHPEKLLGHQLNATAVHGGRKFKSDLERLESSLKHK